MSTFDELEDDFDPKPMNRGKGGTRQLRANFGTLYTRSTFKCVGVAGLSCSNAGVLKSGKLWYCRHHAPRGSEG